MRVIINGEDAMNYSKLHELPFWHDIRCNSNHGAKREIIAKPMHPTQASIYL